MSRAATDGETSLFLWDLQHPDTSVNNYGFGLRLGADVDLDRLHQALRDLVADSVSFHELPELRDGRMWKRRMPPGEVPWSVHEVESEEALAAAVRAFVDAPVGIVVAPLIRCRCFVHGSSRLLVVVAHHATLDAVSIPLLVERLRRRYAAAARGPGVAEETSAPLPAEPVVVPPTDGDGRAPEVSLEEPDLPLRVPDPDLEAFRAASVVRELDAAAAAELGRVCREVHVTPMAVFLTAYAITLARFGNVDAVNVATAVSNRPDGDDSVRLGLTTVTLPVTLDPSATLGELVEHCGDAVFGAVENIRPFDRAREARVSQRDRVPSAPCALQVLYTETVSAADGDDFVVVDLDRAALNFDMLLDVGLSSQRTTLTLTYRQDLYTAAVAGQLLDHVLDCLAEISTDRIDRAWRDLGLRRLSSLAPPRARTTGGELAEVIAAGAAANPQRCAIRTPDVEVSYDRLMTLSGLLLDAFADAGARPGDRVAVLGAPGALSVVAALAALRGELPYVPLDGELPAVRLQSILRTAGPRVILAADRELLGGWSQDGQVRTVDLGDLGRAYLTGYPATTPPATTPLANVVFTSGSTGEPKGVLVAREAFTAMVRWFAEVSDDAAYLQLFNLGFDPWGLVTFTGLAATRTLLIPSAPGALDDREVASLLASVPGATIVAAPVMVPGLVSALRGTRTAHRVFVGGDVLRAAQEQALRATGVEVHRLYGPTENTIVTSHCPDSHARQPEHDERCLGFAVPGAGWRVTDAAGATLPQGQLGELRLSGCLVAVGYAGASAAADAFGLGPDGPEYRTRDMVRWGVDGSMTFLGRSGRFIKRGSNRFNLGELERLLGEHLALDDFAVWSTPSGTELGDEISVALAVEPSEASRIVATIDRVLPAYGRPQHVVLVAEIPRTPNGKPDRQALDRLQLDGPGADSRTNATPAARFDPAVPGSSRTNRLLAVWRDALRNDDLALDDDLFEAGADSLMLMTGVASMREKCGAEVTHRQVSEARTVRRLAGMLDAVAGGVA